MFRYSTTLEKHKLFISGLPFSCTKEELEDICKAHGTVKDLRLVTNRAGKPKVSMDSRLGSVGNWTHLSSSDSSHWRVGEQRTGGCVSARASSPPAVFAGHTVSFPEMSTVWGFSDFSQ